MLLRNTAYYGLLVCLMALLSLGLQPFRFGKGAVTQRNTQEAPAEDSSDEEESKSETESEIDVPLRRRSSTGLHETDQGSYLAEGTSPSRMSRAFSFAHPLRREQSARNGIGGPLRL